MPTLTDCLESDHRRLDAILGETKSLVGAGKFPEAARRFSVFERGLSGHIDAEEQLLFPAIEEHAPQAAGPVHVMRAEHAELRQILVAIGKALAASDAAWRAHVQALEDILAAHNMKEERVLYPMANAVTEGDPGVDALREKIAGHLGA